MKPAANEFWARRYEGVERYHVFGSEEAFFALSAADTSPDEPDCHFVKIRITEIPEFTGDEDASK